MPPKTDEIKNEKYHQNLEEYMKLVLETLDDENFEKYTEFSYLISMPKFHLLPEKIKPPLGVFSVLNWFFYLFS